MPNYHLPITGGNMDILFTKAFMITVGVCAGIILSFGFYISCYMLFSRVWSFLFERKNSNV